MVVIGICGLIGSGKGECARKLVEEDGFTRISFGERLKDVVAVLLGWPRHLLEGDTEESRVWRETESDYIIAGRALTPREVLQTVGTRALREGFDPNSWKEIVRRRVRDSPGTNFVIDDVRFPNEIETILSMEGGGVLWHVRRPEMPGWWPRALEAAASGAGATVADDDGKPVHVSEWAWARPDDAFHAVIVNDADVAALRRKVAAPLASALATPPPP